MFSDHTQIWPHAGQTCTKFVKEMHETHACALSAVNALVFSKKKRWSVFRLKMSAVKKR